MTSILLVDDQAQVRQGLRMRLALEADLAVVGEAAAAGEAVRLAYTLQPDVVLLDFELPDGTGLEALPALRAAAPGARVVLLTIHDNQPLRARAQAAGAQGFVSKLDGSNVLVDCIRTGGA
jgi:DNA-binding NarL/FixJ family response regulator